MGWALFYLFGFLCGLIGLPGVAAKVGWINALGLVCTGLNFCFFLEELRNRER